MKKLIRLAILGAVLLAVPISDLAWADRGGRGGGFRSHRPHWGLIIGAPLLFYPWWHRHYYEPYPPVVAVPAEPPVYIERGDRVGRGYWYHCDAPEGYYPYVKDCPGGWEREIPRPPE